LSCIQQANGFAQVAWDPTSGNKRRLHLMFLGLLQSYLDISAKEALHFFLVAFLPLLEGTLGE
jgi:hypothetical protein